MLSVRRLARAASTIRSTSTSCVPRAIANAQPIVTPTTVAMAGVTRRWLAAVQQQQQSSSGLSTSGSNFKAPSWGNDGKPSTQSSSSHQSSQVANEGDSERVLTPGEERRQIRHLQRLMADQRNASSSHANIMAAERQREREDAASAAAAKAQAAAAAVTEAPLTDAEIQSFLNKPRTQEILKKVAPVAFESFGNDQQDGDVSKMRRDFKRGGWMIFLPVTIAFIGAAGFLLSTDANAAAADDKKKDDKAVAAAGASVNELVRTKKWHFYDPTAKVDMSNARLFSGNATRELASEISRYLDLPISPATVEHFADGEVNVQIIENIRGRDAYIIQSVSRPVNDHLMELLLLTSAMRRSSVKTITAVVPYYGYARQDRKLSSRVPISAADVATMMETMGVDRVITLELHSGQIQGFFAPRTSVENLQVSIVGATYFAERDLKNPVVVSPDGGGVPRAKMFREVLTQRGHPNTDMAMLIEQRNYDMGGHIVRAEGVPTPKPPVVEKESKDLVKANQVDLVGNVKDCDCIIVEDIIDTGFTVARAAEELKKQGANRVYVFAAHGLFSGDAARQIERAPLDEVVVTNTVPLSPAAAGVRKIKQLTVAPLLAEAIRRVHANQSLMSMFETPNGDKPKAKE